MRQLALAFGLLLALVAAAPVVAYKGAGFRYAPPGATPTPTLTQGPVAVCTNPPATPIPNPDQVCDTTVILSAYEYTSQAANYCNYSSAFDDFNSDLEITG